MAVGPLLQPTFQGAMRVITHITNSNPCVITTSFANQYISTDIVRIYIPQNQGFGMDAFSGAVGIVTPITATTFSLPISTIGLPPFVVSATSTQSAQALAIGTVTIPEGYSSRQNVLPTNMRNAIPQ